LAKSVLEWLGIIDAHQEQRLPWSRWICGGTGLRCRRRCFAFALPDCPQTLLAIESVNDRQGVDGGDEIVAVHVEKGRRAACRHVARSKRIQEINDYQGVDGSQEVVVVHVNGPHPVMPAPSLSVTWSDWVPSTKPFASAVISTVCVPSITWSSTAVMVKLADD
jgi:hypothetical protein